MSTDQSPDERDEPEGTSAGPSPTITHQAKFTVDEDDTSDDSEVISTEGVATDTTLSDWGAESQPDDDPVPLAGDEVPPSIQAKLREETPYEPEQ